MQIDPSELSRFIHAQKAAVLSTLSVAVAGYPFGSVVPYDLDRGGGMIIFISRIAEHYRNLRENPRACLTILDPEGRDDPQSFARASLLVDFAPLPDEARGTAEASYFARFPDSPARPIAHDFVFFRGRCVRARWIGGFAAAGWLDGDLLTAGLALP